jgi:hypothetical protein
MATAEQVLDLSRSQLGNGPKKYCDWYPSAIVPWCCIYQSWVLSEMGLPTHYAWVSGLFDAMRADGRNTYNVRSAMPGDLIAFEWGSTAGGYDHIAMVESVDDNGVTAINGNWGNKVTRAWHSFNGGGIAEIARPAYSNTPSPGPTPTPGPINAKERSMFHLKNTDGRDEFIALTDSGQVVSCWSATPNGKIGPWVEVKPGIAGSNLVAEVAADGRLCVTLAAVGELWGSWQAAPSQGPWCDWFRVNDLRGL